MPKLRSCAKVLSMALNIVQAAMAILVVVLVVWKMRFTSRCLLDGTGRSGRLHGVEFCVYVLAVGVISLIATAVLRCANNCLGCLTANAFSIKNFGEIVINIVMFAWWALAFALLLNRGLPANEKNFPNQDARNWIIAASFFAAASFALDVVFTTCGFACS